MISKNKIIMIFLSCIMLSFIVLPNLKANITSEDVQNAQILADAGVIVDNKTFPQRYNLSSSISRREMLKVMMNLSGREVPDTCEQKFADLPPTDWGCRYAQTALQLGFIAPNKNFRPNDPVSKVESLKMIFQAKGISVLSTSDWRVGYVQKAVELGYTDSFSDYNSQAKRSFVFGVGAKTLTSSSQIKEEIMSYEKPKILLHFESPMNQASVVSNLKIYPEITFTSNWIDEESLELELYDIISKETDFLVNVFEGALEKSGETLSTTFSKTFKISGTPMIEFVSPSGMITDVYQNITVRFSKPIVSLTNLDNQAKCPIEITPSIPGKCVWITTSTFQFRPENGFPTGGKYLINIPSGITTIAGDKTINSKSFEITTPDFALVSNINTLGADEKLNFAFNDEVSLEKFKENFSFTQITNDKLNFSYYKGEFDLEENTNIVSIYPKSGDWGYKKTYTYTISKNLTSARGNVGLKTDISQSFQTNDFLLSHQPVVFLNETSDEKYLLSNLKFSNNSSIITKENPSLVLNFYKEVSLDKTLFSSSLPFEMHYLKKSNYDNGTENIIEDKKQVILSFSGTIQNTFSLKINLSQISSSNDTTLTFQTKAENTIVSYKQINYKKACLETKNDLGYPSRFGAFEFDGYGKVDYMYKVDTWTRDADCSYVAGKHKYILTTRLNPSSEYSLTIRKHFLDSDNYPLDRDYNFSFTTPKALNEDKRVSLLDARQNILLPSEIAPISVAIQTINLTQVQVKVCQGGFDILSPNYLKNPECTTKTIQVNNLGMKPNITVVDLQKIFGKPLNLGYITLEVQKIKADQTEYEAKNDYYISKASFIISHVAATIKSAKNNILWLHNYSSGENITDQIEKIQSYKKQPKYSVFGGYEGEKVTFEKDITFTAKKDGVYELGQRDFTTLLITLKNGEEVLLDNMYNYYYSNNEIYNYITTDKPIYKAGETVEIAGISRLLQARGFLVHTAPLQIDIIDSQYKQVFSKTISPNSLGAFDVQFLLPEDAKLGSYTLNVGGNSLNFFVEEYEKPDFKVDSKPGKESYLYGETATVDVFGEYYIGLPVSNGEGRYTMTSSDFYFDGGKTTGYTFGEQHNLWWDIMPRASKLGGVYYGGITTEKTGNFVLNREGKATLEIPLEESLKDKIYTISSTVTDPNTKKSISNNTTFKAIRSKTFLGIQFDRYYYAFKDTAQIGFVSVDIEGNKLSNQKFDYKVYKIDYTFDENTYRFDSKETLLREKSIVSNTSGFANETFVFDQYGEYRFEINNGKYTTTQTIYVSGGDILRPAEAQNNIQVLSDKDMYKVGNVAKLNIASPVIGVKALVTIEKQDEILNYKIIDIDAFSKEIEIEVKQEYLPNFDFGVYIIKDVSSSKEKLQELQKVRLEMNILEQALQKENNPDYIPYRVYDLSIIPFPRNEDLDTDKLSQLVLLRNQERNLLNAILPSYYTGSKEIKVDLESIKLQSNIQLDKVSYLPGEKQVIELTLTDNTGKPITGETTLSIIDQSLLALKNNKTDIVDYFYSPKYSQVQTFGNLTHLIKRIEFSVEENVEAQETAVDTASREMSKSLNGLGGAVLESAPMDGDMFANDIMEGSGAGEVSSGETRLRTEFKDLAFYKTKVKVEDGKAFFEVPALPDNLTTWVISGFAYTSDTKVGNFETTFQVQKELAILPQIPRFFLDGDETQVGALVVNNTNNAKNVEVILSMNHITPQENMVKNVVVPSQGSILVSFDVEIKTGEGEQNIPTQITLGVTSGNLVDTIRVSKPIYPSKTSEYVFTNGSTFDLSYEEKLDFESVGKLGGYLEVSLGATILTNLTKNLDQVLYFPGTDLSSQLTFLENALALEDLYKKLDKIPEFEALSFEDFQGKKYTMREVILLIRNNIKNYLQSDNGLAYFADCSKWFFSETCSDMYITAKFLNLNITVPGVDNTKVLEYYKKALVQKIEDNQKYNINTTQISDFLPIALHKDMAFINTYFKPESDLNNGQKLDFIKIYQLLGVSNQVATAYITDLKNAILVEARGSVLPTEKSFTKSDNSVSTAKMIQVLIGQGEKEKLFTENLVRFLISNRDENGNYYTHHFSQVIRAIASYIDFTGELENISFEAKTYLNSQNIMSSSFHDGNKFEIDTKIFPFATYLQSGENSLGFEKIGNGKLYYDVGVRYYLPVSEMTSREEGITVVRSYYDYDEYQEAFQKECFFPWWRWYDIGGYCTTKKVKNIDSITTAKKGDYIVGRIEIILDKERTNVVVNDYIPAGAEILNTRFDTVSQEVKDISGADTQFWQPGFDFVEQKDDRVYLYAKYLPAGSYSYTYVMKANHSGKYNWKPATAELLEKPEIWGRSSGGIFEIQ